MRDVAGTRFLPRAGTIGGMVRFYHLIERFEPDTPQIWQWPRNIEA